MNRQVLDRFRNALEARRDRLRAWLDSTPDPDRCDALEGCSEAPIVGELTEAIDRIEDGVFGRCIQCGDEVELDYLELDFTACICLDHYDDRQKRALEDDLERAAKAQQHLFPCCVPALPGVELAAHALPAGIVSGDYYDFFSCCDRNQGIAIADVMGKGVSAGMLMANLQASLRILGEQYDDLHDLASRLNGLFIHNLRQVRFISLFLAAVDTDTRTLRYCNAGHNPPLFWEAATDTAHWLKPSGPALGLTHSPSYRSVSRSYAPGDILFLYTDGLAEARNAGGLEFGAERLESLVRDASNRSADEILATAWRTLHAHTNGRRHDDTTIVVAKFA